MFSLAAECESDHALIHLLFMTATEALESNFDAAGKKSLDEAIMWYNKFLGFQVVAGEGNESFNDMVH
jgi:kinetochore protein Spc25